MWEALPVQEKEEYRKMILAFASLSEMFAQKAEDGKTSSFVPIINSKYQETLFQKVFSAKAEDVGNTSYDVSLEKKLGDITMRYLVGIKTFGIGSGYQKIAQFKGEVSNWSRLFAEIEKNCKDHNLKTKKEISDFNREIYLQVALLVGKIRNMRIESSEANAKGFDVEEDKEHLEKVYHVLMPSKKDEEPCVYVGETSYLPIDLDNIKILGCTTKPVNFEFTDGNHTYRFTFADSQLLMDFHNNEIVKDRWKVKYLDDPYSVFAEIANKLDNGQHSGTDISSVHITEKLFEETYSWKITNASGEVERYSGFNAFYGLGSKLRSEQREKRINSFREDFLDVVPHNILNEVYHDLLNYFAISVKNAEIRRRKEFIRNEMLEKVLSCGNKQFTEAFAKLVFRPMNELYIPLPNSRRFHEEHPDFFAAGAGRLENHNGKLKLVSSKEERTFKMIFEPSGNELNCFITQDVGKAIESDEKQEYLGQWLLRQVFRLGEYEPLTAKRLDELGINGIRLAKNSKTGNIHFSFIWIDDDDLPDDYIGN